MKNGIKGMAAALSAVVMVTASPARAVDVKAGSWDLSFTGNVNAFATYTVCGVGANSITGVPLACSKAKDAPNNFAIESGLLPSALVIGARTRAADMDTGVTIGLYPGLHVADTRTGAGSNNNFSMDVRQIFFTIGDKSWGTVKMGKDLGVFGGEVILSDMLLLGVGAGTNGALNHNVTLGHIGSGYLYADWIPQVAYSTPSFSGLQVTVALVEAFGAGHVDPQTGSPLDLSGFVGQAGLKTDAPGAQARVSYDFAGPVPGRAWVGGMWQHANLDAPLQNNPSLTSVAGEAGVKGSFAGLAALAYGYVGDGVGTTLIGLDATPGTVTGGSLDTRKSYGFFGQLTYKIPDTKLRPGISYGASYIDLASGESLASNGTFLRSNVVVTAALFYSVTDALTLTAEYDHVRSNSQAGDLMKSNSFALGGIIFF